MCVYNRLQRDRYHIESQCNHSVAQGLFESYAPENPAYMNLAYLARASFAQAIMPEKLGRSGQEACTRTKDAEQVLKMFNVFGALPTRFTAKQLLWIFAETSETRSM